jgi:drug/metabolite transporter (DMT)-like permease
MQSHRRGIVYALAAASIYGLVPNIARLAFDQGIPALESVVARTIVVVVALGAFALLTRQSFAIAPAARRGLLLQVIATVFVSSCYIASVQFIPVGVAVLVFFTFPVIIALLSPLVERRSPSAAQIGLALLAFAGVGISIGPQFAGLDGRGLVLASLSAIACALQFFSGRMLAGHIAPAPFGALVHVAVLPVVLVIMLWAGAGDVRILAPDVSLTTKCAVALVGISYCAAYFLQMSSVAQAPASVVAPYFNLEPVVTTVMAVVLLGEKLTLLHLIGGGMVLAAIVMTGWLTREVRV